MASSATRMILESSLKVKEDLGLSTGQDVIEHESTQTLKLFGDTTPDIELVYAGTVSLTAGTATIDLTSLSDAGGNTISTTGKKIRAIKAVPTSTNTGAITMSEGASNGYALFGSSWSISLTAGQHFLAYTETDAPDIAAADLNIDLAGTGTESIYLIIVFG